MKTVGRSGWVRVTGAAKRSILLAGHRLGGE